MYLIYIAYVFLSETLTRSIASVNNCNLYKKFTIVIIPTFFTNCLGLNNTSKEVSSISN